MIILGLFLIMMEVREDFGIGLLVSIIGCGWVMVLDVLILSWKIWFWRLVV